MDKGFTIKCENCGSDQVTLIPVDDEYCPTVTISCDKCENETEIYCC